mmetsp:Transcript_156420/g.501826  ORF Transcript_156420/g.501826 Transcript_156420/m.501826 type:complete len:633 (+) Transcript_156420:873-2771(+)
MIHDLADDHPRGPRGRDVDVDLDVVLADVLLLLHVALADDHRLLSAQKPDGVGDHRGCQAHGAEVLEPRIPELLRAGEETIEQVVKGGVLTLGKLAHHQGHDIHDRSVLVGNDAVVHEEELLGMRLNECTERRQPPGDVVERELGLEEPRLVHREGGRGRRCLLLVRDVALPAQAIPFHVVDLGPLAGILKVPRLGPLEVIGAFESEPRGQVHRVQAHLADVAADLRGSVLVLGARTMLARFADLAGKRPLDAPRKAVVAAAAAAVLAPRRPGDDGRPSPTFVRTGIAFVIAAGFLFLHGSRDVALLDVAIGEILELVVLEHVVFGDGRQPQLLQGQQVTRDVRLRDVAMECGATLLVLGHDVPQAVQRQASVDLRLPRREKADEIQDDKLGDGDGVEEGVRADEAGAEHGQGADEDQAQGLHELSANQDRVHKGHEPGHRRVQEGAHHQVDEHHPEREPRPHQDPCPRVVHKPVLETVHQQDDEEEKTPRGMPDDEPGPRDQHLLVLACADDADPLLVRRHSAVYAGHARGVRLGVHPRRLRVVVHAHVEDLGDGLGAERRRRDQVQDAHQNRAPEPVAHVRPMVLHVQPLKFFALEAQGQPAEDARHLLALLRRVRHPGRGEDVPDAHDC